ncbi:hypothetical protein [Qipengyuania spongiae]|uniref:Uncharacterized protein n=1 Tax=Qipengyuania spongiae TaxID=2909673 RepID=A0ABY5SW60_9SPHN|nr:hypothetical protein [Qipengyuania spongiae]UVI38790.1 hypothetical protein L1F33_11115 [Qipengyuania spongiae]
MGAATVLAVSIVAQMFRSTPDAPLIAHLELIEPVDPGGEIQDVDMIANKTGNLARECGAEFFETTFLYTDHAPTLEIALTHENKQVTECILARSAQQAIETQIIYRKATNAQTH